MRVGLDIHQIGERQTGNETYLVNLIDALQAAPSAGRTLYLYRTRQEPPTRWRAVHRRLWPHQPLVRIPLSFPLALARDAIDVAHFQYVTPPLMPCPVSVMVHDVSFATNPEFFARTTALRMQTLIPLSMRRAEIVLTSSEFSKREIVRHYGIAPDRVAVTYAAAGSHFRIMTPDEQQTALGPLAVPERFILAVGNVQPRKNLARLLEAYAQVRTAVPGTPPLVLVGQPHFRAGAILEVIDRLQLTPHVVTTGYVTDAQLVALYNRATVFMYVSLYEGFGLPILEAMACGAPVVTSTVTSMPEVAGDAALLVDPLNVSAIADAMRTVLRNPDLADDLRQRGLARAAEFSWSRAAAQTVAAWHRISRVS